MPANLLTKLPPIARPSRDPSRAGAVWVAGTGAFLLLVTLATGGFLLLASAMFVLPLAVLLGLTVPRSVRAFFAKRPVPGPYPTFPPHGPWTP